MAVTAFRISRRIASRSSKALPSTGGSDSRSWAIVITMPHRWEPDGAGGNLGLTRDELLEPAHGRRRLQGHIAYDGQPPLRRLHLLLAEHHLRVGQDGGQRVVEVVAEPADGLAERAELVVRAEGKLGN